MKKYIFPTLATFWDPYRIPEAEGVNLTVYPELSPNTDTMLRTVNHLYSHKANNSLISLIDK